MNKQNILVLPIKETELNEERNTVKFTVFLPFLNNENKLKVIEPINIENYSDFNLIPVGITNFLPPVIGDNEVEKYLQNILVAKLNFENSFVNNIYTNFIFTEISNKLIGFPIIPTKEYYLAVLTLEFNLISSSYTFTIQNINKMVNENVINTLEFNDTLPNSAPNGFEELLDVANSLQFTTLSNQKLNENIKDLIHGYLLTSPNYTTNNENK